METAPLAHSPPAAVQQTTTVMAAVTAPQIEYKRPPKRRADDTPETSRPEKKGKREDQFRVPNPHFDMVVLKVNGMHTMLPESVSDQARVRGQSEKER